jgi:hypothetical protein
LIRGDRPMPFWVYGQRYARNLASLAFPDAARKPPTWAGWATLVPLVAFQVGTIGLMLRIVRDDPEQSSLGGDHGSGGKGRSQDGDV